MHEDKQVSKHAIKQTKQDYQSFISILDYQ